MFKYGEKVTESHVAVIKEIDQDGFWVDEANWKPCKKTTRFIEWGDEHLIGFLDLGPINQRKSLVVAEPQWPDAPNTLDRGTLALSGF